jgi:hypothetical protein
VCAHVLWDLSTHAYNAYMRTNWGTAGHRGPRTYAAGRAPSAPSHRHADRAITPPRATDSAPLRTCHVLSRHVIKAAELKQFPYILARCAGCGNGLW